MQAGTFEVHLRGELLSCKSHNSLKLLSLPAAIALVAVAAGCGGGGASSTTASAPPSRYAPGGSAEAEAPKGASPVLREIYRQFPAPKANPKAKGSAQAIKAGEAACEGKTPLEVKAAFYSAAVEEGTLEPDSPEGKMIGRLASYEAHATEDSAFAAGQLAADTYKATLPKAIALFGYEGCVYSLARGLEHRLAPDTRLRP